MTYYALLLFFVVEYVRPGNHFPPLDALRLNTLVPVTAIIGTFLMRTPVSGRDFVSDTTTKAMGILLSLLVVSTLFATVTAYAFEVTKNVFAYMLFYMVLVRQLGDVKRIKGVFMALTLVHVIVIGLSPDMFTNSSGRASVTSGGFLGDGNDFALSVNVCLPLCLFLLMDSRGKLSKGFWTATLLVLVMSIVATKSRGGTIALMAVGLYFWLKSQRKAQTAALIVVAVAVVLVAAPPEYFQRMGTMTDAEESSAQGRIEAWKTSSNMALANPLLGAGAGHFGTAYGRIQGGRWMTAHSIYFLLLGELGLPGILTLIFLIVANLAANGRLQREVKRVDTDRILNAANLLACTSASLVGFAVAGAFLSAAYYPHLYVVCGLMVATRRVVRKEIAALSIPAATTDARPDIPVRDARARLVNLPRAARPNSYAPRPAALRFKRTR